MLFSEAIRFADLIFYSEPKLCQHVLRHKKARMNITAAFPKWNLLMRVKGLQGDTEAACFLQDT